MVDVDRPRRWPAYAVALLLLGYAAGKAVFALQARLGFPGGPPVPAAEAAAYLLDPAFAQWLASASGVVGACVALATVTPFGRWVSRTLMLVVLAVMTLAVVGVAGSWRWTGSWASGWGGSGTTGCSASSRSARPWRCHGRIWWRRDRHGGRAAPVPRPAPAGEAALGAGRGTGG
ncbi:hypothetical protein ACFQQB_57090 [Nonomuraea rubra]|uniref:hypothetical protein n=1 Tax=Nonomuraea rubra TaxID=46180 RepID=UPI00360E2A2C